MGGGFNEKTSVFEAGSTGEPVKVSTDAIDAEIQKFEVAEIAEAFSFAYVSEGTAFVGFTLRSVNIPPRTFVYNVTASRSRGRAFWFEQQSGVTENGWRINSVDFTHDKLLVSDVEDGRIGYLDIETYTEYEKTLVREKITGPLSMDGKALVISLMELTVDAGQGLIDGQGDDPRIVLRYSDDGARTWSSELWRPLGKIGEYEKRVEWRRLGRTPVQRVFSFRVTDPVKVAFLKLEMELSLGN